MSPQELVFILIGLVTAGAAVLTVTSKNLVHAALFLAVTLAGIAGVFLVLHADFLALVQLIVYVGAVVVLFLFGLMLTRAPIGREALDGQNRGLGLGVAVALFGVLVTLIVEAFRDFDAAAEITGPAIADLGMAIFASWVFPFEVLGVLLTAALIGAILLARRDAGETGEEQRSDVMEMSEAPSAEAERRTVDTGVGS